MLRKARNTAGLLVLGFGIVAAWVFLRGESDGSVVSGWVVASIAAAAALFWLIALVVAKKAPDRS